MNQFEVMVSYLGIGFISFLICWKVILWPLIFKPWGFPLDWFGLFMGVIAWPITIGLTCAFLVCYVIYRISVAIGFNGPIYLERFMDWMNKEKPKRQKSKIEC